MEAAIVGASIGITLGIAIIILARALTSAPSQAAAANERTRLADERGNKQELRAERAEFELGVTKQTLEESERHREALAKELQDAIESTSPGDGLAATDVHARLLRIAEAHRARRGPVPATTGEAVPDASTTTGTGATGLPPLEDPRLL